MSDERDRRELIKELAGAVSTQANVANRAWLALMTVALFAVLPRVPTIAGNVSLPFNLGDVDSTWFHTVVFSILVVLAIAFATAHAQQVRAHRLAHSALDSLATGLAADDRVHPRELFDILRLPSLNRVAPLAQSLRGKYQFYPESRNCPTWLRLVTVGYYGLLKAASWIVYFGLPSWALWQALSGVSPSDGLRGVLVALGGCLAGVALFHVFLSEIMYSKKVLPYLWRGAEMEADEKIKKPATAEPKESSHHDNASERFWLWRSNTQVIFALAFNAGILLLMFFQWRAMNRQLKIMADQFESQQRSWIGIKHLELGEDAQPGKPLRFTITIENSGHTPALRVIGHHHFRTTYPTLADVNQELSDRSVNAMAPGSVNEYSVNADAPISYEMLKDRSLVLYVFGKLTYEDSFGEHLTTYCGIWKPEFGRRVSSCRNWNNMR